MFEFGGIEFLVVLLVGLVILGPTQLPTVARTVGLWGGRLRRAYHNLRQEVEREVGMDEVRRQLHNEQIMAEMKAIEKESNSILEEATVSPLDSIKKSQSETSASPSSKQDNVNDDDVQEAKPAAQR